jgi:hypothetical protein
MFDQVELIVSLGLNELGVAYTKPDSRLDYQVTILLKLLGRFALAHTASQESYK